MTTFQNYAEMSENPLMYWKINSNKFPLAIPATSAPVERLFSIAAKIKFNAKTVL